MVYLFIGDDELAKQEKLSLLKKKFLTPASRDFNFETLYAKETPCAVLQEALARLPVNASKRVVVVKDAQKLPEKAKEFLLTYVKKPLADTILVLDFNRLEPKDAFQKAAVAAGRSLVFGQKEFASTFDLCDAIDRRHPAEALGILHQLLSEGEKPERILGGLRYRWERGVGLSAQERMRRMQLLLSCDIDIKRGRLKPEFSLEKLLIGLSSFS